MCTGEFSISIDLHTSFKYLKLLKPENGISMMDLGPNFPVYSIKNVTAYRKTLERARNNYTRNNINEITNLRPSTKNKKINKNKYEVNEMKKINKIRKMKLREEYKMKRKINQKKHDTSDETGIDLLDKIEHEKGLKCLQIDHNHNNFNYRKNENEDGDENENNYNNNKIENGNNYSDNRSGNRGEEYYDLGGSMWESAVQGRDSNYEAYYDEIEKDKEKRSNGNDDAEDEEEEEEEEDEEEYDDDEISCLMKITKEIEEKLMNMTSHDLSMWRHLLRILSGKENVPETKTENEEDSLLVLKKEKDSSAPLPSPLLVPNADHDHNPSISISTTSSSSQLPLSLSCSPSSALPLPLPLHPPSSSSLPPPLLLSSSLSSSSSLTPPLLHTHTIIDRIFPPHTHFNFSIAKAYVPYPSGVEKKNFGKNLKFPLPEAPSVSLRRRNIAPGKYAYEETVLFCIDN